MHQVTSDGEVCDIPYNVSNLKSEDPAKQSGDPAEQSEDLPHSPRTVLSSPKTQP